MVDLEKIAPAVANVDDAAPSQKSVSVSDSGMGDPLRYDAERLHILVQRHFLYTKSARAKWLLDRWDEALPHFVKVMPREYRRALTELSAETRQAAE
jgi:glutamate synthase (NADPH/NADH) large chain